MANAYRGVSIVARAHVVSVAKSRSRTSFVVGKKP
jgi:hypothetical protein